MKILIVQDHLRSGGTERQSILLANAFASAGHETTLLSFRPGGRLQSTVQPSVHRVVLQPFDTGLDWWAPGLISRVRQSAPEIVLCMGRMANCRTKDLQEAFPSVPVIASMRTGKKLPRLYQDSLLRARHVVANSQEAKANLTALYSIPAEKITVIHNSLVFPSPAEPGTREKIRAEFGASEHTTVLLDVAMFRPEKNQRELIEIAAGLPADFNWQLWLAGEGPARAACEKRVRQKGLEHAVRFLGWQNNPAPFYAAADIAVHASTSEALCNFLIEAQAHGLPAVASDTQGITECFLPGSTGFAIAPDDREGFRKQLQSLATTSLNERASLAACARDFARQSFDHDRQVGHYLDLFQRLLT